jgi:DNA-binding transcriptional regulator YdaS (Cro superfamily)
VRTLPAKVGDTIYAPERFREIGQLIVGPDPGWQSRLARALGIAPAHVSNIVAGNRTVTADMQHTISKACAAAAVAMSERADALAKAAAELHVARPEQSGAEPEWTEDDAVAFICDVAGMKPDGSPKNES